MGITPTVQAAVTTLTARVMSVLTNGQRTFRDRLAAKTGLSAGVITAWMLAEESGGAARSREGASNHNWLNIAYYDSGPGAITRGKEWKTPQSAADATAAFLKGQKYGPSAGIRKIIHTAGKSADAQISAITNSGWAGSGYEGGNSLRTLYSQYGRGVKQPSSTHAAPAVSSGGTAPMQQPPGGSKLARLLSLQGSNASPYDVNAGAGQVAAINPLKSMLGRDLLAEQAGKASRASASTSAAPAAAASTVVGGPGFGYDSGTPSLSHPTIQSALRSVASQYGHKLMVGTTTNHSKFTTSGNISDHYSGNAADIPASGQALTKMGQAALVALGKPRSWALQQKGGLYTFNHNGKRYQVIFNTTQGGNHWNHLHVGVA